MKQEKDRQFPEKPIVIYTTPDGAVKVDVLYDEATCAKIAQVQKDGSRDAA